MSTLISRLDAAESLPGAVELRDLSYRLLGPRPGARVVDVGCGAGRAVAELTDRGAVATGVDPDEEMVAIARQRRPGADFQVAGAYDLPFGDGELAGYRTDKVYHLLADLPRATAEARRVLAPGGRAVLVGQDWDTLVVESADPALTRTVMHARADGFPSPRAARRFRDLLLDAGFTEVTVEARTLVFTEAGMLHVVSALAGAAQAAGAITAEQCAAWTADQTERARAGRLFFAVPMFVAAGTRP
jgi:SAM-dependent methyltransferase